jgi:flagellar motor protein MotB
MRRLGRTRAQTEEEESVFVTMTDMTISFLLIIMILLAFFATQISQDEEVETVPLSVHEPVRDERDRLMDENVALRLQVTALQGDLAITRAELEAVTEERDRLLEENERLRTRIAELEGDVRDLNARVEEQEAEIARLRARLERLEVANPLEAYLSEALVQRRELLIELRDRLKVEFPELEVVISREQDALRFQGEGLFGSGSSLLERRQRGIVRTMGRLLDEILVCFTLGERAERGPDCDSGNALIEAVQIEGHTDSDRGRIDNITLSTNRANETFFAIRDAVPDILAHENLRGQPVMSVSGYGEMRPIETNETAAGKAANRRIDLRIIMYAPSTVEEVEEVGRRLDTLRAAGVSR